MAHHQQSNHDRSLAAQGMSLSNGLHGAESQSASGDDESTSDDDEPPHFSKTISPTLQSSSLQHGYPASLHLRCSRKESLLTQALLTSPDLTPLSDAEAPVLTSDGGLTSPARTTTPSPPPPVISHGGFASLISSDSTALVKGPIGDGIQVAEATSADRSQEVKVEEGLGRRRCISFACGRQSIIRKQNDQPAITQANTGVTLQPADPPKRPCMLRFACPMKPSQTNLSRSKYEGKSVDKPMPPKAEMVVPTTDVSLKEHRKPASTIKTSAKSSPAQDASPAPASAQPWKLQVFNRIDFQKSEATRFHEFAGPFNAEDEWVNEQTAYRQKITINDTLRKENAIRELAEEAEEEALEEEADEELDGYNNGDGFDDEGRDYSDEASDGGNETDDEDGFADSDDESDGDSDYQFWTPGLTTAATSTDHLEHIRPTAHRAASESSIEIAKDAKNVSIRAWKQPGTHRSPRMRPGTPELPDDAEFVIGTLDEDRPLQDAYMSCLEERRRSRHKPIPQDIDPSFPTSEPEADNDDDDEENATQVHDEPEWVTDRPDSSGEEYSKSKNNSLPPTKVSISPMPSPKRIHSPPPKRGTVHRSPPPRRLFGQSTHRLRSPPPMHGKLTSPPSSRRPSVSGSPYQPNGINMPHLAQRPNLTHTTSLPRTPNPFWDQHRRSRFHGSDSPLVGSSPKSTGPWPMDLHSRGPIDIVQGLETKRQRRKDKFWRQHCRNAGKEKERRCQPGKGAERMRELGLEMADRLKGYGQKPQLVLSV